MKGGGYIEETPVQDSGILSEGTRLGPPGCASLGCVAAGGAEQVQSANHRAGTASTRASGDSVDGTYKEAGEEPWAGTTQVQATG